MRSRCQRNESKGDSRVVPAAGRRLRPAAARAGRSSARAKLAAALVLDLDLHDLARFEGGAQDLSPLGGGEAREGEVHPQVGLAGRPQGAQRLPQVPPAESLLRQRLAARRPRASPARHRSKRLRKCEREWTSVRPLIHR